MAKKTTERKGLVNDKDIAMDFAQAVHEKFDRLVKASVLFGSQAKHNAGAKSDIDIIFIVDDSSISWDMELIAWYREELGKIISSIAKKHNRDLHVNTVKLTTWWNDMLRGDAVVMNILRYGEVLIDSGGFFIPLKALLLQGKIHATPESAYSSLERAPMHLARSRAAELGSIEGIYWAMADSAQAALIIAKKVPPSPEQIPQLLKETFVDIGMLKINYVNAFRDLFMLHKRISHGEITNLKGADIDRWQELAEGFLSEMTRLIDRLIEIKK
jgi:predicted nucleotidyltransferase